MRTKQHKYRFYATLLDTFWGYLNSDVIWDKYWGWSENPPHTPEEFHELQFQGLIDRINRVPIDSEAADKGTAFNEIIDCMIENRKSSKMDITRLYLNDMNEPRKVTAIKAIYNNREFTFPIQLCREFVNYFKGALTQQWVEAILPTSFGDVLLCGLIDELMPNTVHDIKTTGSYSVGKFKNNFQHLVYPYALLQGGSDVRKFEYNVAEIGKYNYSTYTETYVFNPDRDIPVLTNHCEDFIRFLEENRNLVTDTKIFGGEN